LLGRAIELGKVGSEKEAMPLSVEEMAKADLARKKGKLQEEEGGEKVLLQVINKLKKLESKFDKTSQAIVKQVVESASDVIVEIKKVQIDDPKDSKNKKVSFERSDSDSDSEDESESEDEARRERERAQAEEEKVERERAKEAEEARAEKVRVRKSEDDRMIQIKEELRVCKVEELKLKLKKEKKGLKTKIKARKDSGEAGKSEVVEEKVAGRKKEVEIKYSEKELGNLIDKAVKERREDNRGRREYRDQQGRDERGARDSWKEERGGRREDYNYNDGGQRGGQRVGYGGGGAERRFGEPAWRRRDYGGPGQSVPRRANSVFPEERARSRSPLGARGGKVNRN
jgi:hypothetical protein